MAAKKRSSRRSSRPGRATKVDLYAIAEQLTRRMRRKPYFEEHTFPGGRLGLKFETSPADLYVEPGRPGRGPSYYLVQFSWPYETRWDEMESVEVDIGKFHAPLPAVEAAVEASKMTEKQIRQLFEP